MKMITVAAASLNQTPLDWEQNIQHHLDAIKEAREQQVSVLAFPELSLTGYGCEDQFLSLNVYRRALSALYRIVPHTKGMIVSVGLPLRYNDFAFNTVCLIADGEIRGFVAKQHLANDLIYYETRWFKRWKAGVRSTVSLDGTAYPIGDLIFEIDSYRLGFEICEDAWVADRPAIHHGGQGVNIILNPSASHFAFGRDEQRRQLIQESSRTTGTIYIYSNYLGLHSGRILYDGRCYIAAAGRIQAASRRFSHTSYTLLSTVVDLDVSRATHIRSASAEVSFAGDTRLVPVPNVQFLETPVSSTNHGSDDWEESEQLLFEEFARGCALSLFDYLRKTRQKRFVVSLSGGRDSSTVACLVRLMLTFAIQELGIAAFKERLSYHHELQSLSDEASMMKELLHCIYQRSKRNSSVETETAARELATQLSASYYCWDIDPMVDVYEKTVSNALDLTLDWDTHDIPRQNIQARVRAPGAWLMANLLGGLLLTTSNRSEASVGYATMDGDTAGGWNPIGGVDKVFLYEWLHWLETRGPQDVSLSFSSLSHVNALQASAELRSGNQQTDEADLMPYPILDLIERSAVSMKYGPAESFALLKGQYADQFTDEELFTFVKRFYSKWSINQWKRERYAPSVLVDNQNLDPKTACRFPILSGGFQLELKELEDRLFPGQ